MTTYKSKIGLEVVIPLLVVFVGSAILLAYQKAWPGLMIIFIVSAFIVYLFASTDYRIDDSILKIRCGFLVNQSVVIGTIKEIKETTNPISSPATSLDRLKITYNRFDSVMISPKDKKGFINNLISINPAIKVTLKKTAR